MNILVEDLYEPGTYFEMGWDGLDGGPVFIGEHCFNPEQAEFVRDKLNDYLTFLGSFNTRPDGSILWGSEEQRQKHVDTIING